MATQLQVRVHGPGDVRLDEAPVPEAGPRDVVVRVAACGICGSDVGYVKQGGLAGPTSKPMPLGHELAGVIDEVGGEVDGWSIGDRVVVDPMGVGQPIGNGGPEGGFTPRLLVRGVAETGGLCRVSDELPLSVAALAEPLGVGMRAIDRSRAQPGEKVVVMGSGPIGLASLACLIDRGVDDVVVVDYSDARLELASKLGARAVLNAGGDDVWSALRELHGTAPVLGMPMLASDVFIEATGAAPVIGQLVSQARSEARLVVVGLQKAPVEVNFIEVMMKEIDILGSIAQPSDWNRMLDLLSGRDLTPMVTHTFALEQFPEAFAVACDPSAGGKVMIRIAPDLD